MPHPVSSNAVTPDAAPVSHRSILAGSGFRRLLAIRLTSQLSDGWFQAGLAGSLLFNPSQRSSPLSIAAGFAILLLPYSVLGPYVGVLLDRWDRRTSLSMANLIRAALVLPAAFLLWQGAPGVGFAASALIIIAVNRFFLAGLSASLPRVVDDAKLVPANALAATLGTVFYSIGLFGSAVLIAFQVVGTDNRGYGVLTGAAASGYLLSGLLARTLFGYEELGPLAHERRGDGIGGALVEVFVGMAAGVRHLAERGPAYRAMALQAGYRFFYGMLTLAVLLLFSRYFGQDLADPARQNLWDLGKVVIAGAAGAALAALITPPAVRRFGAVRWLAMITAAVALVVLACGLPFVATLLVVAAALVNIASQSMKIVVDTTLQHECDDLYRGRIFSVNDTAFNLFYVGGVFAAALSLPPDGRSIAALVVIASGYLILSAWFAAASRPDLTDRSRVGQRP